ncbi:hypothetical protein QVD17_38251 [Tagetes erecta]|uniref:Piwi domain-containing protein n=1 Tax=Tagetes erecta TaxID=13708 RepID=A0AAD8NKJ0_TARER|nr:hypothetical protein QVD17_38251 [Tagetes erecta]
MENILEKLGELELGNQRIGSRGQSNKAPTDKVRWYKLVGMDVSHDAPGHSDVPSIAVVVSSRKWPFISRYRASVRSQSSRFEMIDGLFKHVAPNEDEGMIRTIVDNKVCHTKYHDFYLCAKNGPIISCKNLCIRYPMCKSYDSLKRRL